MCFYMGYSASLSLFAILMTDPFSLLGKNSRKNTRPVGPCHRNNCIPIRRQWQKGGNCTTATGTIYDINAEICGVSRRYNSVMAYGISAVGNSYNYPGSPAPPGKVRCETSLGGLLNHYFVDAA